MFVYQVTYNHVSFVSFCKINKHVFCIKPVVITKYCSLFLHVIVFLKLEIESLDLLVRFGPFICKDFRSFRVQ